ncbi:hypothetical protein DFH09DRAFT_1316398 [Mycena vulgaris]|nr:hypothetical protein DFH09DRAFT_1482294 [Mycena vulgaris]KAJ6560783.1 hypothetical protein DFH09DRAFT_1316398 [Mycena vulgaris]
MKHHPHFRALLAVPGAERLAYGARMLTEGGLRSLPQFHFPGGANDGEGAFFSHSHCALSDAPPLPAPSTPAHERNRRRAYAFIATQCTARLPAVEASTTRGDV